MPLLALKIYASVTYFTWAQGFGCECLSCGQPCILLRNVILAKGWTPNGKACLCGLLLVESSYILTGSSRTTWVTDSLTCRYISRILCHVRLQRRLGQFCNLYRVLVAQRIERSWLDCWSGSLCCESPLSTALARDINGCYSKHYNSTSKPLDRPDH